MTGTPNGKKALITEITGQDESYLAELLLDKGYGVYGLIGRPVHSTRGGSTAVSESGRTLYMSIPQQARPHGQLQPHRASAPNQVRRGPRLGRPEPRQCELQNAKVDPPVPSSHVAQGRTSLMVLRVYSTARIEAVKAYRPRQARGCLL